MNPAAFLLAAVRLWLPTTRIRRRQAAIAALLSRVAFDALDEAQRARVDAELIALYKPFGIYPWWKLRSDSKGTDAMACDRALAMWRLGLPTGVLTLTWDDVLHPWHKQDPAQLTLDFRPFHADTDAALDYLAAKGVRLPESLHYGQRWLKAARATGASA